MPTFTNSLGIPTTQRQTKRRTARGSLIGAHHTGLNERDAHRYLSSRPTECTWFDACESGDLHSPSPALCPWSTESVSAAAMLARQDHNCSHSFPSQSRNAERDAINRAPARNARRVPTATPLALRLNGGFGLRCKVERELMRPTGPDAFIVQTLAAYPRPSPKRSGAQRGAA